MEKLDLVIFGASGFTGKYTVQKLLQILPEYPNLTWGIAGRSRDKLAVVLSDIKEKTDVDLTKIPLIEADVKDEESMVNMAKRAKVVANCVGPYLFYGEAVVKSCIASKTHYVDVTGEPQFMERIQLKYNKAAEEAGVYVVSACGFDSIPVDLGVVFLEKNFKGTVNAVESYLKTKSSAKLGETVINYGTYQTVIHGIHNAKELKSLRKQLYPEKISYKPSLKSRSIIHKPEGEHFWCLPFLGSDKSVVYRTQRYFLAAKNKRPIQMQPYFAVSSLFGALAFMMFGIFFFIATKFKFTRELLLNYPKFFTFGTVSFDGPTEEVSNNTKFSFVLKGTGWDESTTNINEVSPNKKLTVKVSGTNPGYGSTCVGILLSALTILKEQDKMPGSGGVLTTGAAFYDTSIIDNLTKHELKFEVVTDGKSKHE